jgi:hypothetical protein
MGAVACGEELETRFDPGGIQRCDIHQLKFQRQNPTKMPTRPRPRRTASNAYCDRCSRVFINDHALEQHLNASPRHNICPGCDMDYHNEEDMNDVSLVPKRMPRECNGG